MTFQLELLPSTEAADSMEAIREDYEKLKSLLDPLNWPLLDGLRRCIEKGWLGGIESHALGWARYVDPLVFPGMPAIGERMYRTVLRMQENEKLKRRGK